MSEGGRLLTMMGSALWLAAALSAAALAQQEEAVSGMSRQMRMGVRYYEKGEDLQAMDRFMDVLTRGDPAERSMANEYINLITQRMNTGEKAASAPSSLRPNDTVIEPVSARAAAPRPPAGPEIVVEPGPESPARAAAPSLPPPAAAPAARWSPPSDSAGSPPNKALMKKEIKARLRMALEAGLRTLRGIEDVRVLMMENGDPQAVAIPSPLLFQSGIAFQKEASPILDALTQMAYSLGSAQIMILPEGTAVGDAKVLDMRRTMGISAHLYSAGVAPARVRVNLLNTQVEIPKPLQDFKGIVVLFVYNQPLGLVVESSIGDESGPPLSLGVFPAGFRPDKSEGVIIEFSVQDPPAGLVSWRFQLLQPAQAEGRDLAPLQEVVGGSPVFHQIYWNGRQNYFGPLLPAGRYECVLTATDAKNRQRTLHRWIQLQAPAGSSSFAAAGAAPAARLALASAAEEAPGQALRGAPSADLPQFPRTQARDLIERKAAPARSVEVVPRGGRRRAAGRRGAKGKAAGAKSKPQARQEDAGGAGAPAASVAPSGNESAGAPLPADPAPRPKPSRPPSGSYQLDFNKNTHQLTAEAEKRLAQVAETVVYYPLEHLKIVGYSHPSESQASSLAERRAQMVAGLLINKYQVEPKKIRVESAVAEAQGSQVQIHFVKNE